MLEEINSFFFIWLVLQTDMSCVLSFAHYYTLKNSLSDWSIYKAKSPQGMQYSFLHYVHILLVSLMKNGSVNTKSCLSLLLYLVQAFSILGYKTSPLFFYYFHPDTQVGHAPHSSCPSSSPPLNLRCYSSKEAHPTSHTHQFSLHSSNSATSRFRSATY